MTTKTSPPPDDRATNDSVRRSPRRRPSLLGSAAAWLGFILLGGLVIAGFAASSYVLYLDNVIRTQFEGKRWALPARVYARPLELFPGMPLSAGQFAQELELLRYRVSPPLEGPGAYARSNETFEVSLRSFTFWDGTDPARRFRVKFQGNNLKELNDLDTQENLSLVRLEPLEIAAIYPAHHEDRILVKRQDLPPVLVDTLLAVEDRTFYEHFGIDLKGISRALLANLKAGRTVQGGSTLTQQLVKNFFLSNERTLQRKINEAVMAILIDWRYRKDDILEAYCNEVYLGQDGSRAIHGLGLASRFYFDRDLAELDLPHIALLIGLINGPSKNDPRRNPEQALERRALVLDVMVEQQLIGPEAAAIAKQMPLDVSADPPSGVTHYPAFLDLVHRQLQQYYKQQDLTSAGLRIFTTLDPLIQSVAERGLLERLKTLEKGRRRIAPLEGAAVVVATQTADVLALVGGRDPRLAGFNRALDAQRPAGSLLKPAIYLTALEHPDSYTLATLIDDTKPVVYAEGGGKRWSPQNYDRRFHGRVMLREALAHSYNIPAARVGLDMDVVQVVETLQRLGIQREMKPYPSLLLGAVDLAPLDIAQMYETLASGGFRIPLRAIREVTTADGQPLQHYSLDVDKVVEPGPAYLIINAMQQVVQNGTASAMKRVISPKLNIAGKTGTTDEYRDSWFAGFSGNKLAVVWIGRDDNDPIRMSGADGALPIWMNIMSRLNLEPLELTPPPEIEMASIDPGSGLRVGGRCGRGVSLPFLSGSVPRATSSCGRSATVARKGGPAGPRIDAAAAGGSHAEQGRPMSEFFKRLAE